MTIYAPHESAFFKSAAPAGFIEPQPGLPPDLRYFDGKPPERRVSGTPWEKGRFEIVTGTTEILPGFYVLTTRSQKPGTMEMNEVSLAIRTPRGLAVVVGCSHPGVEKIVEEAAKIDPRIHTVAGGFSPRPHAARGDPADGRLALQRPEGRACRPGTLHEREGVRRVSRPLQRKVRPRRTRRRRRTSLTSIG